MLKQEILMGGFLRLKSGKIFIGFLVFSIALIASSKVAAQSLEPSGVFNPKEVPLHALLAERVEAFIEHERNARWGEMYDMLYKPEEWKVSREKFIKDMQMRAKNFPAVTRSLTPSFVGNRENPNHPQYAVFGCLEDEFRGRIRRQEGGI